MNLLILLFSRKGQEFEVAMMMKRSCSCTGAATIVSACILQACRRESLYNRQTYSSKKNGTPTMGIKFSGKNKMNSAICRNENGE